MTVASSAIVSEVVLMRTPDNGRLVLVQAQGTANADTGMPVVMTQIKAMYAQQNVVASTATIAQVIPATVCSAYNTSNASGAVSVTGFVVGSAIGNQFSILPGPTPGTTTFTSGVYLFQVLVMGR